MQQCAHLLVWANHGDDLANVATEAFVPGLADGDKKRENCILLHEGFFKLGAPLTVVLVCFVYGVGIYIGRKTPYPHVD
jgi:hypothetical protein